MGAAGRYRMFSIREHFLITKSAREFKGRAGDVFIAGPASLHCGGHERHRCRISRIATGHGKDATLRRTQRGEDGHSRNRRRLGYVLNFFLYFLDTRSIISLSSSLLHSASKFGALKSDSRFRLLDSNRVQYEIYLLLGGHGTHGRASGGHAARHGGQRGFREKPLITQP